MSRRADPAATVYRWELRKLRSQKRTYLGLGAAIACRSSSSWPRACAAAAPTTWPFGRYIHQSGLAIPLVMLLFGSIWLFPLITALVAGDIIASEDHNGTLKTIFTRSLERGQIFAGKTLAAGSYAIAAILLSGFVAIVAGLIASGFNPLHDAVGQHGLREQGARARRREPARLPDADPRGRLHRAAALGADAQQRGGDRRHADGLAADPADRHPPGPWRAAALPAQHAVQRVAGPAADARRLGSGDPLAWVCALYGLPSLFAAYLVFLRRDVAGG